MKSTCFIVNTASNSGKAGEMFRAHLHLVHEKFPEAEIYYLESEDRIDHFLHENGHNFSLIIACGGDGTIHETAKAVLRENIDCKLGLIPAGSGNDFAKSLGLRGNIADSLETIEQGKSKAVDAIKVNNSYFINTYGIGLDGSTNRLAADLKQYGRLRYLRAGITALLNSETFYTDITAGETTIHTDTWMVAIANGRCEGGRYIISPGSEHSDGRFEIIVLEPISRFRLMIQFLRLSAGMGFNPKVVKTISAKSCTVQVKQAADIHADGEIQPSQHDLHFEILPRALKCICK